jgi:hypothetical protein
MLQCGVALQRATARVTGGRVTVIEARAIE